MRCSESSISLLWFPTRQLLKPTQVDVGGEVMFCDAVVAKPQLSSVAMENLWTISWTAY